MACGIYVSIAVSLLEGKKPQAAYEEGLKRIQNIYSAPEYQDEISHFNRVFNGKIAELPVDKIQSSGYVVHTLEASLWCLLNSSSYALSVLKAVNLGGDTDTTAAVTGGLAGIYYGVDNIPAEWIEQIARFQDIIDLAARFDAAVGG
jgi:ADP-ribosylglycohydrolase